MEYILYTGCIATKLKFTHSSYISVIGFLWLRESVLESKMPVAARLADRNAGQIAKMER